MSMKESYQKKLRAELDQRGEDIDKLKAKADKAEASVKIEYYEQIEKLRTKQASAKDKLIELTEASDDAWEDLKAGTENAWHSLGEAVKSAASRFK